MTEPTLESVLAEKYNIFETLKVEGKFLACIRFNPILVSLGISDRSLVIAKLILGGGALDYELQSIVPLSLISIDTDKYKRIAVTSHYKPTQYFAMCTGGRYGEIWPSFVDVIIDTKTKYDGDSWLRASLESVSSCASSNTNKASVINIVPAHTSTSTTSQSYQSASFDASSASSQSYMDTTRVNISTSTSSLQEPLPSWSHDMSQSNNNITRRRSWHCIEADDITFDKFTNDAPTRFSEFNGNAMLCAWNGAADDIVKVKTEALNKSNNFTHKEIGQQKEDKEQTESLSKRFVRAVRSICCKEKKQ